MTRSKRYRLEKLHCGICGFSGCNRKKADGRCLCKKHLKSESARTSKLDRDRRARIKKETEILSHHLFWEY